MLYRRYSTEGIVLSQTDYGEGDRIITILTKDHGKVRVIAKGVRKLKSKKRGHIDVFNQIKFSASRGKDMDLITEAELIEAHTNLRKDLRKVSVAYYLLEIVSKLIQTEEKHEYLYYFLAEKLHELDTVHQLKRFRFSCAQELLTRLGFWPSNVMLDDPDKIIEDVIEKKLSSTRVGKQLNA